MYLKIPDPEASVLHGSIGDEFDPEVIERGRDRVRRETWVAAKLSYQGRVGIGAIPDLDIVIIASNAALKVKVGKV